jgi:hypothetical protein
MAQDLPVGQGPLIIVASRSHLVQPLYTTAQPSTRPRNLYLTTHNTHNRQKSMPQAGFEPAVPTGERSQTHVVNRATSRVGSFYAQGGYNLSKYIAKPYFHKH